MTATVSRVFGWLGHNAVAPVLDAAAKEPLLFACAALCLAAGWTVTLYVLYQFSRTTYPPLSDHDDTTENGETHG